MGESILDQIAKSNRLPILFVGSGIPKRYLSNYPSWIELLETSFQKYEKDSFQFQKNIARLKRENKSDFEINACLGTIIENGFNDAFFDRKITLSIGNKKNPSWVKRGISPYKMYLSHLFKNQKLRKDSKLLEELEKFKMLKNKTSAVITTNYDTFLEEQVFQSDYEVFVRQNELFSPDSYNIAEIYKIHGSAKDAESIIITEDDYKRFKESRKLIIAKMLTLFAEAPIIFMGYSFTDENVREIIEDFLSCLTEVELKEIRKHFVFISYKKGEENLIEVERTITTKNNVEIPFVEIQTDNYGMVYEKLGKVTPGISPIRVRETRKVIKTIVDQSLTTQDAESVIVGIDDLEKLDFSTKPLAIAIGYKDKILSTYGYGRFEDINIFEDIIYNNKHFDSEAMCSQRLNNIQINRLIPVFKYVKNMDISKESKLGKYIEKHNKMDKIIANNIAKTIKNAPEFATYDELMKYMKTTENCRNETMASLKNIGVLDNNQLRKICAYFFEKYPKEIMNDTCFKRCVMILDLRENV